ncbi:transmembrane protein 186-like [Argonauta hians]
MFACFFQRLKISTIISKLNYPKNASSHFDRPSLSQNYRYQHFLSRTFIGSSRICNKLTPQKPVQNQLTLLPLSSPGLSCFHYSKGSRYSNENFEVIYRFPYIVHMHLLSRFKIYQTALSLVAVPICYILLIGGQLSLAHCHYAVGYCTIACIMLYAFSFFLRRLIGIIAYDSKEELLKVSHLTFWGGRRDIFLHAKSVIPISDMSDNPNDIYVRFRRYDTEEELLLVLKYGGIKNLEKLKLVIGEIR